MMIIIIIIIITIMLILIRQGVASYELLLEGQPTLHRKLLEKTGETPGFFVCDLGVEDIEVHHVGD